MNRHLATLVLLAAFAAGCHNNAKSARGPDSGQQARAATQDGSDASGQAHAPTAHPGGAAGTDPRAQEEACVDEWLAQKKLDPYGNAEGTMYMGGTPLFDERTGERTDRLTFIYRSHAEARQKCAPQR